MLTITIPHLELFDEVTETFVTSPAIELSLEHSLASLSKWESKFEKPFLGPDEKSTEEVIGYIEAMTLTPNLPPEIYRRLTNDLIEQIYKYIDKKMSATWFTERKQNPNARRDIITAEIIYYWMIQFNIPFECENWHLNKLFTLIKVCNEKNAPEKKSQMNQRDLAAERRKLNEERKAKYKTSG